MKKTKDKTFQSYYDIEGPAIDYLNNQKNLKKIRSKNLRDFIKFYELTRISIYREVNVEKQPVPNWKLHQYEGARYFLYVAKYKEIFEKLVNKLQPYILKRTLRRFYISPKTVYDYMNAMKYIRAVEKAKGESNETLKAEIPDVIKMETVKYLSKQTK